MENNETPEVKTLSNTQESIKAAYAMMKSDVAKWTQHQKSAKEAEAEFDKEIGEARAKANETHHSSNTGYGEEFYPTAVQGDINMNLIYRNSSLAQALSRGYMGTNMPATYDELILGESDYFIPNDEFTGATGTLPDLPSGTQKPQTDKLSISQAQFKKEVQISKKLAHYGPSDFVSKVTQVLTMGAAKTIDAFILNADSDTSGNINLDGGSPSGVYYLNGNSSIRLVAIDDTNTHGATTLAAADFVSVMGLIGDYAADLDDLLWIMPMNVYLKAMQLDEVITMDKFGPQATVSKGVLAKLFGIDILVTNVCPSLAQASGKVSSTGWSNTVGQFALVKRSAVIHGSGDPFEVFPTVIPGKGIRLTSTFDYGAGVAYEKAGLGKTVGLGVNVTV